MEDFLPLSWRKRIFRSFGFENPLPFEGPSDLGPAGGIQVCVCVCVRARACMMHTHTHTHTHTQRVCICIMSYHIYIYIYIQVYEDDNNEYYIPDRIFRFTGDAAPKDPWPDIDAEFHR
jgi:hypothetical protein